MMGLGKSGTFVNTAPAPSWLRSSPCGWDQSLNDRTYLRRLEQSNYQGGSPESLGAVPCSGPYPAVVFRVLAYPGEDPFGAA